ncbi:LysR family transcriptional regulator [Paenibacillus eucommiae]|uniref:DNA-binding transcriptional LysR family regulator n=2 Tax=Paenibacillus eucommiae TaxID=1355755 RepID=A0ABS4J2N2_9BACL|nr:LysR family transcriptional regulator [Paenibacillus eucommiae]MBP1994104.1 DNA-binding transcriptional LysR family regulator [Paenibacillus eucommiae]
MEIRQLEYFMAICQELHFTRASVNLGVTQPTLSHQIKALEDEIGILLFDRIGKKTMLTEAGLILLKHCRNVFNSLESAREEIAELQEIKQGSLSIGALTGELNQLVSKLLVDFHQRYPQIKLKVVGSDDLIERVIQNEIDFGLTILPVHDERITTVPLYEENLYLTVSSNHPLANREKIDLEEITGLPFIVFPKNHKCRQQIEIAFQLLGISLKPIIETDAPETIISLIEAQAGVSILSKTLINIWNNDNIKIIKIENPSIRRQIGLIYHKEKYMGFAAREFINVLKTTVTETHKD